MRINVVNVDTIRKVPFLFYNKTVLNVYNFDLNCKKKIFSLQNIQNVILERTESELIMNINFTEKTVKTFNNVRDLEHLAFLLYNSSQSTQFITAKRLFISFPQIFDKTKADIGIDIKKFDDLYCNQEVACFIYNEDEDKNQNIEKFNEYKNVFLISKPDNKTDIPDLISPTQAQDSSPSERLSPITPFKYNKVALGGSFDHLHIGHNLLLTTAALCCKETLYIGITSQEMLCKKDKSAVLQPFSIRENNVRETLSKIGFRNKIQIKRITDNLGGAGSDSTIDALILTEETVKGGLLINQVRAENNVKPVDLICAKLIEQNNGDNGGNTNELNNNPENSNGDFNDKISSRKIRQEMKQMCPHLDELFDYWKYYIKNILPASTSRIDNSEIENNAYIWFSQYRDLFSQPWRKFHNLNHIYQLLIQYNKYKASIKDKALVLTAMWFHDLVIVPSRKDDEERSFGLFKDFSSYMKIMKIKKMSNEHLIENNPNLNLPDESKIKDFIIRTKYHSKYQSDITEDKDLLLFLDIDLSFLGQEVKKYREDISLLRQEYFNLTDDEWIAGRKRFIEKVLQRKRIYYTDEFSKEYEEVARRNLKEEFVNLSTISIL